MRLVNCKLGLWVFIFLHDLISCELVCDLRLISSQRDLWISASCHLFLGQKGLFRLKHTHIGWSFWYDWCVVPIWFPAMTNIWFIFNHTTSKCRWSISWSKVNFVLRFLAPKPIVLMFRSCCRITPSWRLRNRRRIIISSFSCLIASKNYTLWSIFWRLVTLLIVIIPLIEPFHIMHWAPEIVHLVWSEEKILRGRSGFSDSFFIVSGNHTAWCS